MRNFENPRSALTDHLDSSIEQVKQNLEAVSFWAHAVSGFSQPIPAYVPEECMHGFQAHPIRARPTQTRPTAVAPMKSAEDHAHASSKRRPARRRA